MSRKALTYKTSIQFWVVILLLLLSFGSKVYREEVCNNFKDDVINNKLQEISQRYAMNELAEKQARAAAAAKQA